MGKGIGIWMGEGLRVGKGEVFCSTLIPSSFSPPKTLPLFPLLTLPLLILPLIPTLNPFPYPNGEGLCVRKRRRVMGGKGVRVKVGIRGRVKGGNWGKV
jgi:hypothetical protein